MTRTSRFVQGAGWGYVYQLIVMVVGLWLTPFFLRQLGPADYGLWLIGLQIINTLMLADFGILALFPRTIGIATGRAGSLEGASDLPLLVGQTLRIVLYQTLLVGLGAAIGWFLLPAEWSALRQPLGLMLAGLVVLFPARILPAILTGLQLQAVVTRIQMGAWAVATVANVAFLMAGFGLYALAFGWVLSQLVSSAVALAYLWRRFPRLVPGLPASLSLSAVRAQFSTSFWYSISQVSQLLLDGLDLLIIGKWLGAPAAVLYSCTGKLISVMSNQPQMLLQLAVPALSEIGAGADGGRIGGVTSTLARGMLLISGAVCCLVLVVNETFVRWWVGGDQYGGLLLTVLMALRMLVRHLSLSFAYAALALGCERRLAITGLLDGVVTASAMLLLTPMFGPEGAAAGSLLGVLLVSLPMNTITLSRAAGFSPAPLMASFLWRFAIAGGCCLLAAARLPMIPGLPGLALAASVALAAYSLLFLGYVRHSPLLDYVRLAWNGRAEPDSIR